MNIFQRTISSLLLSVVVASAVAAQGAKAKPHPKFTAAQAQAAALKKYPGKVVGKVELENEDGKWQYAVNIRSGKKLREVMVSADTGKIASVEVTSAKEEAREKAEAAKKKKHSG